MSMVSISLSSTATPIVIESTLISSDSVDCGLRLLDQLQVNEKQQNRGEMVYSRRINVHRDHSNLALCTLLL